VLSGMPFLGVGLGLRLREREVLLPRTGTNVVWVMRLRGGETEVLLPRTGTNVVPQLRLRDTWLQDSSAIIDEMERRFPEFPVVPQSPGQRLACYLLELLGDEWLLVPAFHYRWAYSGDGSDRQKMPMWPRPSPTTRPDPRHREALHVLMRFTAFWAVRTENTIGSRIVPVRCWASRACTRSQSLQRGVSRFRGAKTPPSHREYNELQWGAFLRPEADEAAQRSAARFLFDQCLLTEVGIKGHMRCLGVTDGTVAAWEASCDRILALFEAPGAGQGASVGRSGSSSAATEKPGRRAGRAGCVWRGAGTPGADAVGWVGIGTSDIGAGAAKGRRAEEGPLAGAPGRARVRARRPAEPRGLRPPGPALRAPLPRPGPRAGRGRRTRLCGGGEEGGRGRHAAAVGRPDFGGRAPFLPQVPGAMLREHYPRVVDWCERCHAGGGDGAWLEDDEVPATLLPLLSVFFEEFWPVLQSTCKSVGAYPETPPPSCGRSCFPWLFPESFASARRRF
jgi:glutathione S-transferase